MIEVSTFSKRNGEHFQLRMSVEGPDVLINPPGFPKYTRISKHMLGQHISELRERKGARARISGDFNLSYDGCVFRISFLARRSLLLTFVVTDAEMDQLLPSLAEPMRPNSYEVGGD